jgi:hypothetical protein
MYADGYLAMFAFYNYSILISNMVVRFLESMPTNILIILLAAGTFALASKVNALESSQETLGDVMSNEISSTIVDIEVMRKKAKPPSEHPNTAILIVILERMTQLEAQLLSTSPSPSPSLSLSLILTQVARSHAVVCLWPVKHDKITHSTGSVLCEVADRLDGVSLCSLTEACPLFL